MAVTIVHDDLSAVGWRRVGRFLDLERVLGVLLNKRDEALERTVAVVVNELAGTRGLELQRGEAGDAEGITVCREIGRGRTVSVCV